MYGSEQVLLKLYVYEGLPYLVSLSVSEPLAQTGSLHLFLYLRSIHLALTGICTCLLS